MLTDFRGGREGEREGERHRCEREALVSAQPGTKPATQACAVTGDQTWDLSVYGMMLQPTEPHWPGLGTNIIEHLCVSKYLN